MAYDPFIESELYDPEEEDALEWEMEDEEAESVDADFEEFSPELEELAEDAWEGDEEAEDEFLGALGSILIKALPTIASAVLPAILGRSQRMLESPQGRKVLLKNGPAAADHFIDSIRRRPGLARNPANVRRLWWRSLRKGRRPYWYRRRYHRWPRYGRRYRRCYGRWPYRRCYYTRRPHYRRYRY